MFLGVISSLIFYAITNLMYLFLRTNSHDDVSVSTPVSTADEMTPRNMPARVCIDGINNH
jgi:hypothetical protein